MVSELSGSIDAAMPGDLCELSMRGLFHDSSPMLCFWGRLRIKGKEIGSAGVLV